MKIRKVTIIIPAHNSGQNLIYAVESIKRSTIVPFKMIIVNDGSTDDTPKIARELADKYPEIKVIDLSVREKPKVYDGRLIYVFNQGIKAADKDSDIYLTHDDVIHFPLHKKDWMIMFSNAADKEDCGLVTSLSCWGISDSMYKKDFRWVGTWSMYIPNRTIKEIGLLDEKFIVGDDIDYTYRVTKAKKRVYVVPFWVDHHRESNHQYSEEKDEVKEAKEYGKLAKISGDYFKKKHGIK